MNIKLIIELINICEILNRNNVKYLIIGGCAVNYYGYKRKTLDIDIWYNPSLENCYTNIYPAFNELGLDKSIYKGDITIGVIKTELCGIGFDCLTKLNNFPKTFNECYRNKKIDNINNIELPYISLDDLILSKEQSKRNNDVNDTIKLKEIKNSKRNNDVNVTIKFKEIKNSKSINFQKLFCNFIYKTIIKILYIIYKLINKNEKVKSK